MFSWFARRQIDAFERQWGYDCGYLREMLAKAGIDALLPLNALGKVSAYRRDVPTDVYYAAKITAAIGADCGPCAQLVVSMAEAAGVDLSTLRAIVSGDRDSLPYDAALGVTSRVQPFCANPAWTFAKLSCSAGDSAHWCRSRTASSRPRHIQHSNTRLDTDTSARTYVSVERMSLGATQSRRDRRHRGPSVRSIPRNTCAACIPNARRCCGSRGRGAGRVSTLGCGRPHDDHCRRPCLPARDGDAPLS